MSDPKKHDDFLSDALKKDAVWLDCHMCEPHNQAEGLAAALGPNNKFFKARKLSGREQRRRFNRIEKRKRKKK